MVTTTNKTVIGNKYKPFIIAEMSGNHNQSLERALEIKCPLDCEYKAGQTWSETH